MGEIFAEDGVLVSRQQWELAVKTLRDAAAPAIKENAEEKVAEAFTKAMQKRIPPEHFGILLSGGVDSSLMALMAKKERADFTCYCVGLADSKDIGAATALARVLSLPLQKKMLTEEDVERLAKKVLSIIPEKDTTNVEVAITALAAIELAKEHGDAILFSGLGSEEIFAGYQRHEQAQDVNAECWAGLQKMWQRDLLRDCALAAAENVELRTPYLDEQLISIAMAVPGELKIAGDEKKLVLRRAAARRGLPEEFAFRKKYAAQYGSAVSRALEKCAKKQGFRYKKDYLASILQ